MSMTLIRWSALSSEAERTDFLERFAHCAEDLRTAPYREHAPSVDYTTAVLRLALLRPSELLLATDHDEVLVRAAVMQCAARDQSGVLGLYEAAPGPEGDAATQVILDMALSWASSQGMQELFAPVDLNTWFSYRFLVPPEPGSPPGTLHCWEPTQPPEYIERFRRHEFEEAEHFHTQVFDFPRSGTYTAKDVVRHTGTAWQAATKAGFRFQRLDDQADVTALLGELHPLCLEAFRENLLFEPVPIEIFVGLYRDVLTRPEASLTHWARDPEGRLAGFVFAFRQDTQMVVKTVAVAPGARGKRLSTALFHLAAKSALEAGIHTFISALVRRDNTSEYLGQAHAMPGVKISPREYVLLHRSVRT